MNVAQKVQDAGMILGSLGVIGFIGIIWLMIYGNLSGNLGFADETITFGNETEAWANTSNYTLAGAVNTGANGWTLTYVWSSISSINIAPELYNYSIGLANFTIDANGVLTNATEFNTTILSNLSLTYSQLQDSQQEIDAENVITNTTGGFLTFFGFSETFFTIAAIILLIFMLLGLLALVWTIIQMQGGKKKYS